MGSTRRKFHTFVAQFAVLLFPSVTMGQQNKRVLGGIYCVKWYALGSKSQENGLHSNPVGTKWFFLTLSSVVFAKRHWQQSPDAYNCKPEILQQEFLSFYLSHFSRKGSLYIYLPWKVSSAACTKTNIRSKPTESIKVSETKLSYYYKTKTIKAVSKINFPLLKDSISVLSRWVVYYIPR